MEIKTPRDLFVHNLKVMYYIENTLVDELGSMGQDVTSDKLKQELEEHRDETAGQAARLERVFEYIGEEPEEHESAALQGLIEESNELNESIAEESLINIAYVNAGMKVERMEITGYEGLLELGDEIDIDDKAEDLLEKNLEEEEEALDSLKKMAKGSKMRNLIEKLL